MLCSLVWQNSRCVSPFRPSVTVDLQLVTSGLMSWLSGSILVSLLLLLRCASATMPPIRATIATQAVRIIHAFGVRRGLGPWPGTVPGTVRGGYAYPGAAPWPGYP